ncbi:unnamed protein product [Pleuronectes platessa]|uniref:Uncharacterized protein n=1 Tax=Pleuronectes platessa TaxID=8262 RepID=A0A9N7YNF9_PLEPL|nr:unnamed protein product [Pleuronectes platessa]
MSTLNQDPSTVYYRIIQMSPEPSSSLLDDSPAASFNQASLSQVDQFPVSQHPDPDRSAPENQQNTALFSPAQAYSTPVPDTQDNSLHSSLAKSPVCGPMDLGYTPTSPSPGPVSPVQPEIRSSPVPDATMSPVQSDAGPGSREDWSGSSPQQDTETESNAAATEDISVVEKQEVEKKTEEEEIDSEAPEQEDVDEVKEEVGEVKEVEEMEEVEEVEEVVFHQIKERQEEKEPVETSQEEDDLEQFPPNTAVSSPLLPQPAASQPIPRLPHSVSPLLAQPSPSRAGPLRASPSSTALPPSCSPHTPCPPYLPLEDLPQKGQQTNQRGDGTGTAAEAGLENKIVSSQSQSQEPVAAATEPTKDEHQSLAEPFLKEEELTERPQPAPDRTAPEGCAGQQPMRGRPVAEDEEEDEEEEEERRRRGGRDR